MPADHHWFDPVARSHLEAGLKHFLAAPIERRGELYPHLLRTPFFDYQDLDRFMHNISEYIALCRGVEAGEIYEYISLALLDCVGEIHDAEHLRSWIGLVGWRGGARMLREGGRDRLMRDARRLPVALLDHFAPDPSAAVERREVREHLARALRRLPEKQRGVVLFRDILEMSYDEVAHAMDIEVEHARQLHHRALKKLRVLLSGIFA